MRHAPPGRRFALVNYGMALALGGAAVLQWNDPDPGCWLSFYLAASVACLQVGRWSRDWLVPLAVGLLGLVWAILLAPGAANIGALDLLRSMDEKGGAVEVARELGGLCITTAWMAALVGQRWRANRSVQPPDA